MGGNQPHVGWNPVARLQPNRVAWHDLEYLVVRDLILSGTRPDGRDGKTLRAIECQPLEQAFAGMRSGELETYGRMLTSEDAKEGVSAFVEKRKPDFKGR